MATCDVLTQLALLQGALRAQQRNFIASMSTFFIASNACDAAAPASARGCDVSHRGGALPGGIAAVVVQQTGFQLHK